MKTNIHFLILFCQSMQEAFLEFQKASGAHLASFYDPFSTDKVLTEISNCLLELETGFVSKGIILSW